jgi:hypothetical protein
MNFYAVNKIIDIFETIKGWFQDWSDACEYANECAPDFSFLTPKSPVWLLLTAVIAIVFWGADRLTTGSNARDNFVSQPNQQALHPPLINSDVATAGFISSINLLAQMSGLQLLLFPELGALSNEVLRRPHGVWASAPFMLVLTPFFTGIIGTLITQHLAYGLLSIFIVIAVSFIIIRMLGSPISPALSAGLLPLTLGETSWWYPPSLFIGTALLVCFAAIRRWLAPRNAENPKIIHIDIHPENSPAVEKAWLPYFVLFLFFLACAAILTDMRFLMFPPLVVIAFEMFSHASICPWSQRPLILPVVCGLTASLGVLIVNWLGAGAIAVALTVICGAVVLRVFSIHIPSAIAVGLLPFVMSNPEYRYSLAVIVSTALLSLSFILWRSVSSVTLHS